MKRWCAVLCAVLVMMFCGCAEETGGVSTPHDMGSDVQPYYPEEALPVIVPLVKRLENGDIEATLHGGLLLEGESEVLTAEQVADGFLAGVRNEDGSVTYTIAGDRYEAFLTKFQKRCRDIIVDAAASGSFESVYKAEVNEDFTFIKATAGTKGYSGVDAAEVTFQSAIYAIRAQAFDIHAAGTCVIVVVDETTGEEYERHTYPDEFELFPVE